MHARDRPDAPALIVWSQQQQRRAFSYADLVAHMDAARERLSGLLRDDTASQRVAILSHNSPAYLVHSLACMSLGAIAVHLNWRQSSATLGDQLRELDCSALLVSSALDSAGQQAAAGLPSCRVVRLQELTDPPAVAAAQADQAGLEDAAVVFFTSGSTGQPKAIPHTHGSLLWWARAYTDQLPQVFDESTSRRDEWGSLSFAPYFHVMGFVANTVLNLWQGAPAYVLGTEVALSPRLLADAAAELSPRTLNTVPYIVEGLCALLREADAPCRRALSRLSLLTYGGAGLASHCAPTLRAHGITTACTYGQTETAGPCMLGEVSGDLNALRPIGGVTYELALSEDTEIASTGPLDSTTGNLVFHGMGCIARMRFLPGGTLRPILSPDAPYDTRDKFRSVEVARSRSTGPWLVYACREDDVLVHTSGEMTNPHPPEDTIKSLAPSEVKNVVMVGNGLPRPAVLVELFEGIDTEVQTLMEDDEPS